MLQRLPKFVRSSAAFAFPIALALALACAGPALAADPTGDWRVADDVANIRVAECNGSMWGVVAWEKIPGGRDKNNPDTAKTSRPTLGMTILFDMKRKPGADQWDGKVYNAKDGKIYDSSIKVAGPDKLEIQGCLLGFLCGGETWTRMAGPIPSSPSNIKGARPGLPKASAATTSATPAAATAPGTPGPGVPKAAGQKPGQPADPVGDICLLPEIARLTH